MLGGSSPSKSPLSSSGGLRPSDRLLLEARVRISRLENELRRNDVVVVDAIKETVKANDEARVLAEKVALLKKLLKEHETQLKEFSAHEDSSRLPAGCRGV